jgi:hypothetical protein
MRYRHTLPWSPNQRPMRTTSQAMMLVNALRQISSTSIRMRRSHPVIRPENGYEQSEM